MHSEHPERAVGKLAALSFWRTQPLILLQILSSVVLIYLLVGLLLAAARCSAHDMPWQLFVFTAVFWPTLWKD